MKNCAQSPTKLRESILNIISHYQVSQKHIIVSSLHVCMTLHNSSSYTKNKHSQCHEESFCRSSGYSPTKLRLTDPAAIQAYEKAMKATLIYKNAESYCRVSNFERFTTCVEQVNLSLGRDTFWIESFNHQLLTYLPKRIHFGSTTFKMRMNLAVMDWV